MADNLLTGYCCIGQCCAWLGKGRFQSRNQNATTRGLCLIQAGGTSPPPPQGSQRKACPRVADAVCTPVPAITGGAGGGKWRAIDKKGTTAAEQLISLDGGAVRYAHVWPPGVGNPSRYV